MSLDFTNNTTLANTNTDPCNISPSYKKIIDDTYFSIFYILTPIYFFVAFFGHLLLIIGFVKRAKTDPAYNYQIFLTVSKTFEIFFFTLFVIVFKWLSGIELAGTFWFKRNYFLMWYASHAAIPIQNSCTTTSLFLAVAMSADRVFALSKPLVYRNINDKKHQSIAVISSFILGWSVSLFDGFRFYLFFDKNQNIYEAIIDSAYVGGKLGQGLTNLRNVVRTIGVVSLIICNIAIIILYRKKISGSKIFTKRDNVPLSQAEEKRLAERKASEKSLTTIVISQSIIISMTMSLFTSFYVIVYAWPLFSTCPAGVLFACAMDGVLEIGDIITFVLVTSIDKNIRQTIVAAFSCGKNQVQPSGNTVRLRICATN